VFACAPGRELPTAGSAPLAAKAAAAPKTTDFYIHAHQDDWQLFMGDRVASSMGGGRRSSLST
jgi:hypothetical protein